MRSTRLPLILTIVLPLLMVNMVGAQSSPQYVVLYAHSYGTTAVLNALPQWGGQKAADISNGLTFTLSPVLGSDLSIYGAITFTLFLRASGTFFGTIEMQLLELSNTNQEALVPGTKIDTSPLNLRTATIQVTQGVGIIDYRFHAGFTILLRITATKTSGTGTALLVWDDIASPTSVRLPTLSSGAAVLSFDGLTRFGRIFETNASGTADIKFGATITDAIGVYRFTAAYYTLTAPNGSTIDFAATPKNYTDYANIYSTNLSLTQGQWQVGLLLSDSSGANSSFSDYLWVTPFYPVSIRLVGTDGMALQGATLNVTYANEASWSVVTDATGHGTLNLPSTQILGPLNLTIGWLGTQTQLVLDVRGPSSLNITLHDYHVTIRIVMNGLPISIPVPGARVTLYQKGLVNETFTGANGVADFKSVPGGNYTIRVDYLFATYQSPLNVQTDTVTTVPVPFPHRTITLITALAIVALASVVVVRRKRGKFYPVDFEYLKELTHGGLPEACFIVIAGNSGSGKSVLLNSLAAEHLASGISIYIPNTEYPDRIRENLITLGVCNESDFNERRMIFIDAYSGIGGGSSKEEFSVGSHTDLTNLGLNISKCLQAAGPKADVYLDSLNPLLSALRTEYLLSFLQSMAARVKANNGKFCITVGSGIEDEDLTKLEESADCVIETQLQEAGAGQRRRLRIKKLRDKPYIDKWTRFQVQQGKGIMFFTRSKPTNSPNV